MGNSVSRVVGCFVPGAHDRERVAVFFSEPLDEGLGHSFCYVRPALDSPHLSPSHSDRYSVVPVSLDSEPRNGSFRLSNENADKPTKNLSETSFKSISGASVSANTSTPRTIVSHEQFHSFTNVPDDRAAAFESTASFSSLPLQPIPRGVAFSGPISGALSGPISGPLERGFMSGPIERGFMSGPLERGFVSGPLERGCMSGPIEFTDRSHFSAPLAGPYLTYFRRRRTSFAHLMRTVGKPVKRALSRTLSKTSSTLARTQRSLVTPVKHFVWGHGRDGRREATTLHDSHLELGYTSSDVDSKESHNLQWAQGKAGEDRVHVVLSEEHGWLFVGIYDGFNGPDAPDFLMSNLYSAIYRELQGLLWDRKKEFDLTSNPDAVEENDRQAVNSNLEHNEAHREAEREANEAGSKQCGGCPSSPCRNCKVESREHAVVTSLVRQDSGNDNAELDDCRAAECQQMEERDGRGLTDPSADEGVPGSDTKFYEPQRLIVRDHPGACPQGLPTYDDCQNLEQQRLPFDPNTYVGMMKSQEDAVALCESAGARPSGDSESNSATDEVRTQPSLSDRNAKNPRPEKHFKPWRSRSLFRPKFRPRLSRDKGSHRKLFPWRYGWEPDRKEPDRMPEEQLKQDEPKQFRHGSVDHSAVVKALARALEATEAAYLEMADQALEENPELALMGSCILVMLMKDEDVYVMNVGDSRAIVAQRLRYEPHDLSNCSRGVSQSLHISNVENEDRIGARDSLLRLELERIIEETPTELEAFEASHSTSNAGPPMMSLSLNALQLSTDHSTSVEEEVLRIKAEHPDDGLAILNDRVKGRLKVTRAFGAGFLKKPRWNSAILEMFRIDYMGSAPYISCIPALRHHRLGPNDRFLVLSSDGLYQYLSNQEVVSHVEWFMEKFPDGDPAQHLIEELLFRAAKKAGMDFHELLDIPQGDRRKYHDDVSVMVISLEGRMWRSSG